MTKTTDLPANAHVKRVTLNLIRLSKSCPPSLKPILDRLANDCEWDWKALTRVELETIYAEVDDDTAYRARTEFQADLETVIDHKWNSDHINCKLCGHNPIRFEFLLRNVSGGEDVWTGSTCIEEYGINVLGAATAEAALKALRAVLSLKRREYDCHAWNEHFPFAGIRLDKLNDLLNTLSEPVMADEFASLPAGWFDNVEKFGRAVDGLFRLHRKHGYLTGLTFAKNGDAIYKGRTAQLFGPHGLIEQGTDLVALRDLAKANAKAKAKAKK